MWDGGIPIDSVDSVNAANRTYYIYKKGGDGKTDAAYFTPERLNAVMTEDAGASVDSYY
ncbi:MAG: hypothetical protein LBL66_06195 [Clostridiales bacterium]|nr:hypothetical protein [Clostridiales bacterium]